MNINELCEEIGDKAQELIKDQLKEHMNDQPYEMQCGDCGKDIIVSEQRVDDDFDLIITVARCECKDEELREEGRQEESE